MWRSLIPRVRSKAGEKRRSPVADWLVLALVLATLAGVAWVFFGDPRGLIHTPRRIEYRQPPAKPLAPQP